MGVVPQTDTRIGSIEVKIKKLDGELARYKEQMSKLRNGPGKVRALLVDNVNDPSVRAIAKRSTDTLTIERNTGARPTHAEAEADVREPACAAHATDVQHGVRCARDREPAEHNGDRGCDEGGKQGAEAAVRQDRH